MSLRHRTAHWKYRLSGWWKDLQRYKQSVPRPSILLRSNLRDFYPTGAVSKPHCRRKYHTESPPTTVSKKITAETLPVIAVEPTEKEKEFVPTESKEQAAELTVTAPLTTKKSTEELKYSKTTNTSKKNSTTQTVETTPSITSQHTEIETTVTEPTKEITPESETPQPEFDVQYWISFAQEYAVSVGLTLESAAVDCWDNPIGAGAHCIFLERDIQSRLNRYAKDEDITDVWIWAKPVSNECYDIYISYA